MEHLKEKVNNKIESSKKNIQGKLVWIADEYRSELEKIVEQFDNEPPRGEIIADGRNDLIKIKSLTSKDLVVKKFNLIRNYDKLRFCFLDSKAIRSLRIALALREIGIKTPAPVAVVEKRGKFNQLLYSYYVTEYIDYDYNLLDIMRDDDHPKRNEVKKIVPSLAQNIKKMHDAGIVHNDLHEGNILINNFSQEADFYYIDLNRGRIIEELNRKKRMNDLARFKFNDAEQEKFMKAYSPEDYLKLLAIMKEQKKKRQRFLQWKRKIRRKIKSLFQTNN